MSSLYRAIRLADNEVEPVTDTRCVSNTVTQSPSPLGEVGGLTAGFPESRQNKNQNERPGSSQTGISDRPLTSAPQVYSEPVHRDSVEQSQLVGFSSIKRTVDGRPRRAEFLRCLPLREFVSHHHL